MDDRTLLRVDTLLKHIDQIFDDTANISIDELKNSNLLLRAVCFSMAQVGEMMSQLREKLGEKYWKLPWYPAKKMRNVIVHDYGETDVWYVPSFLDKLIGLYHKANMDASINLDGGFHFLSERSE